MNTGKWGTYEGKTYDVIESEEDVLQLLHLISANFDHTRKRIKYLEEVNKKLKDKAYADGRLKEMQEQLDRMKGDYYRGFPISERDEKVIADWKTAHEKVHVGGHGASGGKYSYTFVPTAIGTFLVVKCSCGEKLELDDV